MTPLHVRVAAALGCRVVNVPYKVTPWTGKADGAVWYRCGCNGQIHNYRDDSSRDGTLLDFDSDWGAAGWLIDRYLPTLCLDEWSGVSEPEPWVKGKCQAYLRGKREAGWGDSFPAAICELYLALRATGRFCPITNCDKKGPHGHESGDVPCEDSPEAL